MKSNASRLLVALYSRDHTFVTGYDGLELLWPTVKASSRRSLVSLLVTKGYVQTETVGGSFRLLLTNQAHSYVERSFPVFSSRMDSWQGAWALVVFLKPPIGDAQFRYLRTQLEKQAALPVTRGVYLVPHPLEQDLWRDLETRYANHVLVLLQQQWLLGEERATVVNHYKLADLFEAYSGISNEVDRLLAAGTKINTLTKQQKKNVFSVFDRLFSLIYIDSGILPFYFPQAKRPRDLLAKLQAVLWAAE